MLARLRLLGVLNPDQVSALYHRHRNGLFEGTGWTFEAPTHDLRSFSQQPLDDISFGNIHQHENLSYELQDVATLSYMAFARSTGIESVHLYVQKSILYSFQLIANVYLDHSRYQDQWQRIQHTLRSLMETFVPLGLQAQVVIVTMEHRADAPANAMNDTEEDILSLSGVGSIRLLAVSRIESECLLAHIQMEELPVYLLFPFSEPPLRINELVWYKHLIARVASQRIRHDLENTATAFREILESATVLDPLNSPGRHLIGEINKLRKEFISAETTARNVQCRLELVELFSERAMPHRHFDLLERPAMQKMSMVLDADSADFDRHYREPVKLLHAHVKLLEDDVSERLRTLNDISSLNYNLKIQSDLRWLQVITVIFALISLIIGILTLDWHPWGIEGYENSKPTIKQGTPSR